jgi:hypothetical protein
MLWVILYNKTHVSKETISVKCLDGHTNLVGALYVHARSDNKEKQQTADPHTITIPIANPVSCYTSCR